jgi:hypothetical protein
MTSHSVSHFSDSLINKIVSEQDKVLLKEALSCLDAGALRSAYIMTWLTIAESLKNKLREMSLRDGSILKIVGEVERREADERAVDKYVLGQASAIGVIDPTYTVRLEHIYIMRSLYAHPYEIAPSEDEVRAAMVVAVNGVLSHPPFLRHGYVQHLLDQLFTNKHYLDDVEEKVTTLAGEAAGRIVPNLHSYLFESLCKKLEGIFDDPDLVLFKRRAIWFAEAYLVAVNADFNEPGWRCIDLLTQYPKSAGEIMSHKSLWVSLPDQAQDMALSMMLSSAIKGGVETFSTDSLNRLRNLQEDGLLNQRQSDRLAEAIKTAPLAAIAGAELSIDLYGGRIIEQLKSYNWYTQNPTIDALVNVGPERVERGSVKLQEQLGRNVLQTAEGGSKTALALLHRLSEGEESWPYHFIKGLLLECFVNDEKKFRLKSRHLTWALLAGVRGCRADSLGIFEELVLVVEGSEPKGSPTIFRSDYAQAIDRSRGAVERLKKDEAHFEAPIERLIAELDKRRKAIPEEIEGDIPF